jgi:hypothetical protein
LAAQSLDLASVEAAPAELGVLAPLTTELADKVLVL